ncbi:MULTISPECIES: dUTP diphosphatase [Enterobacteriaceae]|uniref:dUTP diphosphatase n=1 Tax=Enterobacteriaceae TaxID=543 RepID=UPI002E295E29|nr:deoxyuridine 5'-triphosphate nucleotidohydrolase [Klebsiella pneumoniae]MED6004888.1 deoxyuridine 5'-triphosphate nucleotidohydrolase [Klebsiella pneumoniae]MED6058298.1 deoxyuridine 5'-triphosphate nucleotidohydrolase [Klebsiella pneumoniae]
MLNVKIKKLSQDAVIPTYAKHGDAGMDLTATSKEYDDNGNVVYGTSLAFEIPHGYVGLLFPRSSNTKKDLVLGNSVGVLDSGYRGEVFLKFKPTAILAKNPDGAIGISTPQTQDQIEYGFERIKSYDDYCIGDRIGQIIIIPILQVNFVEVDELSSSDRGVGGFGSTDPITKSIEENFSA